MTALEKQYQKKTDKEHILDNPDTYIGSVENIDTTSYIFDENNNNFINKPFYYIPGLYKLFDEAIVNCRDHSIRIKQAMDDCKPNTLPMSYIHIDIDSTGTITMTNDGNGIDIAKHPTYDIWIPEMIFGHLRTGTNYDKSEKKIVGGKNGFGSKLIFIWSTIGSIETVDHTRRLKYSQSFKNNLDEICPPVIKKFTGKPYTKISFRPDYARLQKEGLTADEIALFKKRVYDIAAVTDKSVKVKYNRELVPIKDFQQYIDLYIGNKTDNKRVYEQSDSRWEYAVALSPSEEFSQVSFVNGIYTSKGGKHIEYIMNQIVKKLTAYILKKKKVEVKSTTIKEQIMLFLRCDIENPAFDSQTKDYMNTPMNKFGSSCIVSDKFIEKIAKMGVMDSACALTEVKQNKTAKKSDGTKTKSIRGIPKLVDANFAGTSNSDKCTIIFCEGDSAKAGIISGLSKEDRNIIGVYPMKGKLFNVRGEPIQKISENKEIIEIKQILGLETDKVYESIDDIKQNLRYGQILFMTDQDLDGSHIKGLGINLFQSQWNSIYKLNIIGFMNTPIIKAKKGSSEKIFYNEGEYDKWKSDNNDGKGWKVKYYKGLGTSTSKEFKEYFKNKNVVKFQYTDKSDDTIDMVFNKKRADDRKEWLGQYDRKAYLDTNRETISFEDFVHKEMIHFSKYDCERSIPNMMDGLKISLRKILYSAFKKKITNEIKVAQFSGYVSEHSGYHHGEASLNGAIVGMAQDYVGSNNINLFMPNGQFGTRLAGGKDSASERYIFTEKNSLTRYIYRESDDKILEYLNDDGLMVEPVFYAPIIPMVLVNGSKGIGTGFSTDIMCHEPTKIIQYLQNKLKNIPNLEKIMPYYEGFKGSISELTDSRYLIKGCYEKINNNTIRITELPIGSWTDDYKKFIEDLMDGMKKGKKIKSKIKDYSDMSTDKVVDITITMSNSNIIEDLESEQCDYGCNGLEKYFKLYTTNSTTNMHMFNHDEKLHLYKNAEEIIDEYYDVRLSMYDKRKQFIIQILEKELVLLTNKAKYIKEILEGTVDLRNKKKDEITALLITKEYDVIEDDDDYKYLVKMPMDSVSEENVSKLIKDHETKSQELSVMKNMTIQKMWTNELNELMKNYLKYKEQRLKSYVEPSSNNSTNKKIKLKLKLKN